SALQYRMSGKSTTGKFADVHDLGNGRDDSRRRTQGAGSAFTTQGDCRRLLERAGRKSPGSRTAEGAIPCFRSGTRPSPVWHRCEELILRAGAAFWRYPLLSAASAVFLFR